MKIVSEAKIYKLQEKLISSVFELIKNNEKQKLALFLSGGSWIDLHKDIFDRIRSHDKNLFNNLSVYQVDERYNSDLSHEDVNISRIYKGLGDLDSLIRNGVVFNNIIRSGVIEKDVQIYKTKMKSVLEDRDIEKICLVGIGDDSHTAGIKPQESMVDYKLKLNNLRDEGEIEVDFEQFFYVKDMVNVYDAEDYKNRITINFRAIQKMDEVVIYSAGDHKLQALKNIKNKDIDLSNYPDQIYQNMDNAVLFTDQKI